MCASICIRLLYHGLIATLRNLIDEKPALKCKQIQSLTSLLCLDMLVLSMSTQCWEEGFSIIFNYHFRPCQLHDGVSLTHHAIFSHTIFFSISTQPKCPPSCPLPSLPFPWGLERVNYPWCGLCPLW